MRLILALRIALYLQLLLGVALFAGAGGGRGAGDAHMGIGIVIAVLAIVALRPVAGVPSPGLRAVARFFPLVPLLLGLGIRYGLWGGIATTSVHAVLGLITIGMIEAAAGKQRRALANS